MSRIAGVFVGTPQTYVAEDGTSWRSAIYKSLVEGPVALGPRSLDGDKVADTKNHGLIDMAVCVYPNSHYALWNAERGCHLGPGCVGENLTVDGQDESSACIGDTFRIGTALVQVSQPRFPCSKQERRTSVEGFLKAVFATRRTGWYLRVLEPGTLQNGDELLLVERPLEGVTVDALNRAAFGFDAESKRARAGFVDLELLSPAWRRMLSRKG